MLTGNNHQVLGTRGLQHLPLHRGQRSTIAHQQGGQCGALLQAEQVLAQLVAPLTGALRRLQAIAMLDRTGSAQPLR